MSLPYDMKINEHLYLRVFKDYNIMLTRVVNPEVNDGIRTNFTITDGEFKDILGHHTRAKRANGWPD